MVSFCRFLLLSVLLSVFVLSCRKIVQNKADNGFFKVYPSGYGHNEVSLGIVAGDGGSFYLWGYDASDSNATIIVKTDGDGKMFWKKYYRGNLANPQYLSSTSGHRLVLLTYNNFTAATVTKFDSSGNIISQLPFTGFSQ